MLLVIFLSKQQIFSPGLLTRPVLIMSVAEDWGREVQLFSSPSLFCPKPFFTHVLLAVRARRWISVFVELYCVWKDFIIWFIINTNSDLFLI